MALLLQCGFAREGIYTSAHVGRFGHQPQMGDIQQSFSSRIRMVIVDGKPVRLARRRLAEAHGVGTVLSSMVVLFHATAEPLPVMMLPFYGSQ
ncbi:hypothetical protein DVP60_20915 [Yersinia enterocolitica]|uniref:hypothetical protein n=1 Tax=Enterobacterales TaxID=91347 RepID=UPI0021E9A871|nr:MULTISPECIES: hypothetical protein [Enterobacterales]EKN3949052.1 hypothetical protein [Yersinia enterocolitica]EKN6318678.1 hypothetical protein [Yersinia enterocolitica]MDA5544391.1 hypothetical protein [Yersinia rochesterensis]UYJ98509.1 hypothetical protein N4W06_05445 [Yersinia enterocolitica]UZM74053.1 hypothetical protein OP863_13935 [Yersinia sp. SCPM-O-B-9106 (C-191)]